MLQQIGQPVTGFSLPLLNGSGSRGLSDLLLDRKGAVVIFWSAVCSHCQRYDAWFNAFASRHPELGFVAIASRYSEAKEVMANAVETRGLRFPILLDQSGAVAAAWFSQQTPRCYLISADGTLLYRGAVDNFKSPQDNEYVPYLEPAVTDFLSGRPVARPETASFGCAINTVYYKLPRQL